MIMKEMHDEKSKRLRILVIVMNVYIAAIASNVQIFGLELTDWMLRIKGHMDDSYCCSCFFSNRTAQLR